MYVVQLAHSQSNKKASLTTAFPVEQGRAWRVCVSDGLLVDSMACVSRLCPTRQYQEPLVIMYLAPL